jgi:enamine deaminase RidA (YjgF/YER057c/UK114 family)
MEKQFFNPPTLNTPANYSHAVTVKGAGKLVFIAGQTAFNAQGELVGQGDLRAQAIQVFENLKIALAAAGATFDDVVKYTTFIVNYTPDARSVVGEVRGKYLPSVNPPASTLLGVQALAREGMLIEVEAIAVVD